MDPPVAEHKPASPRGRVVPHGVQHMPPPISLYNESTGVLGLEAMQTIRDRSESKSADSGRSVRACAIPEVDNSQTELGRSPLFIKADKNMTT